MIPTEGLNMPTGDAWPHATRFSKALQVYEKLIALPVGSIVACGPRGVVMTKTSSNRPEGQYPPPAVKSIEDRDWWEGSLGQFGSAMLMDYGPFDVLREGRQEKP